MLWRDICSFFTNQFITNENQNHSVSDRCCTCIPIMPPGHESLRGSQQPEGKEV
jgi:hypothetical protein